jgi:iron complex outermembrane receptor protein
VAGRDDFRPESALVVEAGYRVQPAARLAFDVTAFHDSHDDLLGGRLGTPFVETDPLPPRVVIPVVFGNEFEAETYGAELAVDAHPSASWRLSGAVSYLRLEQRAKGPQAGLSSNGSERNTPRYQAHLRSSFDLPREVRLDAAIFHVSELSGGHVPAYTSVDARLAFRPVRALELAVVGHNLLDPHHPEFGGGAEVERSLYGQATLRW